MHGEAVLDALLTALEGSSSPEDAWAVMEDIRRDALQVPELGAKLAEHIARAAESEDHHIEQQQCSVALAAILMEARMDRDNGGAVGPAFLSAVETGLSDTLALDENDVDAVGLMALARCYHQAGLTTPSMLTDAVDTFAGNTMPDDTGAIPDIQTMLDSVRDEAEGDAFMLHSGLSEILAGFAPAMWAPVVMAVIERGEPLFDKVGFYWLLDPQPEVRQAALAGFAMRLQEGRLDAGVATTFIIVRPWLPDDDARKALDALIREAMRREVSGGVAPTAWKHHRTITSLPDGVGAQSVAVAAQSGGTRCVAMLLLKQDVGVTDAYVIPCSSASEQRRLLDGISEQVEMHEVPFDCIETAIAAALADGVKAGNPPAPGMLDVIDILGVHDLRPNTMTVADWVARIDPDETIAAMSPQKRGRLINAAGEWHEQSQMAESWFEDNADLQHILNGAITRASHEKAVWKYLESRKMRWAALIARTAAVLDASKTGNRDAALAFAATAWAIEDGRPLPKTPLMRAVYDFTLTVAGDPFDDVRMALKGPIIPPPFEIETSVVDPSTVTPPKSEKRGELAKLLRATGAPFSEHWIDGYLAAVVIAPEMVRPANWVGPILGVAGEFDDEAQMQRYLDLVMLRHNAFNDIAKDESRVKAALQPLKTEAFEDWCAGFCDAVVDNSEEWNRRGLKKDDQSILRLIDDVSEGEEAPDVLQSMLPAWVAHRRGIRTAWKRCC